MSIYPRERISETLIDSANRGIAMLIAPAGFGKSEAARDALGNDAHWIDTPNNPASVETLARLIIEKASPRSARALSAHLLRPQSEENRAHLAEWCASRLRSVEQPIVFEDFQNLCEDAAALKFVRTVVESTVPNVRWVIISRETPDLPVGTWLARDYMIMPVSAEDLAFDVSEAANVAHLLNVEIDSNSIEELVTDVGGWPLAVRLSLGAWERTRALPALRIRTRVVLFEFIEQQVWTDLNVDDQRFFEAAAHLNELRPRILGAAGFPEARLTLERLHLRLPLLSRLGNSTFRLHELFREFLIERSKLDVDRHLKLVTRLAQALERFGDFDGALSMHVRSESWDAALSLLSRHGTDRIENGHRTEILAALGRFPKRFLDHPVVTGLRGLSLSLDGSYAVAKREIEEALKHDLSEPLRSTLIMQAALISFNLSRPGEGIAPLRDLMTDESVEAKVRVSAAALLAQVAAVAGEIQLAHDAMGFCSSSLEVGSAELRAVMSHRLAYAHLCLGEAAVAEGFATECVQLARSIGLDAVAARGYSVLSAVAAATYSDTALSRKYADSCVRSAILAGDRPMQIYGLQSQLMVASYQGDDELYEETDRKLSELNADRSARLVMWMRFIKVIHEAGRGNVALAISTLQSPESSKFTASERAFCDALLGLLLAMRRHDEAAALLDRPILMAAEKDFESRRLLAYAHAFHALGQWMNGKGRAARRMPAPDFAAVTPRDAALLTVVTTICSTSRQTVTVRQLSQLTEPLLALQLDGHARFLRHVLAPATVTQLTRTELEVLRALKGGGTTSDVADRLGKSSHTVLTHLKSACSKIGCSGRAAAVSYALDMGWLD
jgi:ATP/maltotriose-dependent transcriptional regulator MalT